MTTAASICTDGPDQEHVWEFGMCIWCGVDLNTEQGGEPL